MSDQPAPAFDVQAAHALGPPPVFPVWQTPDAVNYLIACRFSDRRLLNDVAKAVDALTTPGTAGVLKILARTEGKVDAMSAQLDALKTQVEQTKQVGQSAVTLIQGLAAKIEASKDDPAALQALADELRSDNQQLADAVTANTPADPSAGGGPPAPSGATRKHP